MPSSTASVAAPEIERFSKHAQDWWDPNGAFRPLHRLNPVRLCYVRDALAKHYARPVSANMLGGLKLLDVGCGGGLMSEPLARLGAAVVGIDASATTIDIAKAHAKKAGVKVDYRATSTEDLRATKITFDVITALEVIEHVADREVFLQSLSKLLKPGGLLIASTLNRSAKSFVLGIVAAEYILRWVPAGTHDWRKFLKPSEFAQELSEAGFQTTDLTGLIFNPLRGRFQLDVRDLDVNYLLTATKKRRTRA